MQQGWAAALEEGIQALLDNQPASAFCPFSPTLVALAPPSPALPAPHPPGDQAFNLGPFRPDFSHYLGSSLALTHPHQTPPQEICLPGQGSPEVGLE